MYHNNNSKFSNLNKKSDPDSRAYRLSDKDDLFMAEETKGGDTIACLSTKVS